MQNFDKEHQRRDQAEEVARFDALGPEWSTWKIAKHTGISQTDVSRLLRWHRGAFNLTWSDFMKAEVARRLAEREKP